MGKSIPPGLALPTTPTSFADEKTVLIDTVWLPYDREFVANLKHEIDLRSIDYIVINHGEIDHSGALP